MNSINMKKKVGQENNIMKKIDKPYDDVYYVLLIIK